MGNFDQQFVAGDQCIRIALERRRDNPLIFRISFRPPRRFGRPDYLRVIPNEPGDFSSPSFGHTQLVFEDPTEFGQYRLADQQIMFGKNNSEHVLT